MDETVVYLVVIILSFIGVMYGIRSFNAVRIRELDRKIAQAKRMSQVRSGNGKVRAESDTDGIPEWLVDVAEELGVGDYLDSDEMPEELKRLLPLAKGFIDSGGLAKILGGGGKPGQPGAGTTPGEAWY